MQRAFDGPRSVMFEGRSNEFTRGLRCMDVANSCLCVTFQLTQRHAYALTVRLPNTIITAHKRGQ